MTLVDRHMGQKRDIRTYVSGEAVFPFDDGVIQHGFVLVIKRHRTAEEDVRDDTESPRVHCARVGFTKENLCV